MVEVARGFVERELADAKIARVGEFSASAAQQHAHVVRALVGYCDIRLAIAVEVGDCNREDTSGSRGVVGTSLEESFSIPDQYGDVFVAGVAHDQVQISVTIHVSIGDRRCTAAGCEIAESSEAPGAVAEDDGDRTGSQAPHHDIEIPIVVEVAHQQRRGVDAVLKKGGCHRGSEGSVAIARECPKLQTTFVIAVVDDRQVKLAVAVEISQGDRSNRSRYWLHRLKRAIAVAQNDSHLESVITRQCDVEFAVAVDITHRNVVRGTRQAIRAADAKGSVAIAQQDEDIQPGRYGQVE